MFKRTKGYLLLTMLVLTGLAGKFHTETLTGKERRHLVQEQKKSRTELKNVLDGLSTGQLEFKSSSGQSSIQEKILELATIESSVWARVKSSLKEAEKGSVIKSTDHELSGFSSKGKTWIQRKNIPVFQSMDEALDQLWSIRAEQIKYARTTTGNIRAFGSYAASDYFDVYQMMLLNCLYMDQCTREIELIKTDPGFPK